MLISCQYDQHVERNVFLVHFQNAILKRATIFVGECGSKVSQFAKNAPLYVLIILARDEHFLFWPIFSNHYQRGDHCNFFQKISFGTPFGNVCYFLWFKNMY